MENLEQILRSHDIDVSSLKPWAESYSLIIPRQEALSTWLTLRSLVPSTGLWPVLRETEDLDRGPLVELVPGPVDEVLARLQEKKYERPPVEPIIKAAEFIDPAEWFHSRQRDRLADLTADLEHEPPACDPDDATTLEPWRKALTASEGFPRGPWPEDQGPEELCTILMQGSKRTKEAAVVLVPAAESWHVPAYLDIGGWNACPSSEEHVAIWSYWNRRYDAEAMTVTQDVVEMRVGRPPLTRDDAIALAREHYIFCEDIVDQGTETIDRLAASLLDSRVWFFWWD
jgi:hypothetical protein